MKNNIFGSQKIKYGTVAIVFSVVFVAFVLLLNIILTLIGQRYSLYVDMTSQEFYSVSDSTREQLKDVKSDIEIVFFTKKEDIPEPSEGKSALGYVKYLAEQYAREFDFVKVKYIDMLSSPALVNSYKSSPTDQVRTDSVVVNCPETGKKKIIQVKGFFTFDSNGNVYGFSGERMLTSRILQVTDPNKQRVYFTVNHGESTYTQQNGQLVPLTNLMYLFEDQGCEVGFIDLSTSDIPEDADTVVINRPQRDFLGLSSGGVNEIDRLKNFIQNDYGDVIVILDSAIPDLPELRELMEQNFGISYTANSIVEENTENMIMLQGINCGIAQTCGETTSFEYQMHKSVTENGLKILAPLSVPLRVSGIVGKEIATVLSSSDGSMIIDEKGSHAAPNTPIMAVSSISDYDNTTGDELARGNLVVVGSGYLFEFAGNSSFGNGDFFYGMLKTLGNKSVALDIQAKPFADSSFAITPNQQSSMTIVVTAILPVIILVIGTVIWYRRKRK